MKSEVAARPVFKRILYSQAWEDPDCDREGLAIGPEDDVLAVGASGDNALAFVLAGARSVTAIDFNPNQNHLLELKLAALEALDPPDLHAFLGVRGHAGRAFFYRLLRPALSPAAREFWDEQPALIERGVIHVGRFEGFLGLFRRYALRLVHRRRTTARLLEARTLEEQRAFYHERWDTRAWRTLFRVFFSRYLIGRLGRDPAFFKYVEVDQVGETFRRRCEHALCDLPLRENWFIEYILTGTYKQAFPPYLRPENQAALRQRARAALRLEVGSFEEFLPRQAESSYSGFYLSDIFEWMSEEAFAALLRQFIRVSRPGGRLTWRNLLVPRVRPAGLDDLLTVDEPLSRRLHEQDRSFVYGNFVVATVKKP